jgi:hypothetical protein
MNQDAQDVEVIEHAVLSKFDGDGTDPKNEVERVTIIDGETVSHDRIENGEVVGPVPPEESLVGQSSGRFIPKEEALALKQQLDKEGK